MNSKSTEKKIILKKDWDLPPKISPIDGTFEGYFVGRKREIDLLTNEILHKKRGSILVSGHRGVGKTSLVYKVLSEIQKRDKDVIIVLMNAAQLEAEGESEERSKIKPRSIIENLIRRLYTVIRDRRDIDNDIKKDVEDLYKKAVSREFKYTEAFSNEREKAEEVRITHILKTSVDVIFMLVLSYMFAVFVLIFDIFPYNWINKAISLLFAFPVPFFYNYKRSKMSKNFELSSTRTHELYQFDNSIGNLEFDLEQVHRKIAESGKKLIYVIDELDKLDKKQVEESLKYFKNLFTLSDAIFIFIGGEEIYQIGFDNQGNPELYRKKEYTYFTSRYFLTRPLYDPDLSKFLDEIIFNMINVSREEWESFKRSVCFDAQNDFFDLKSVLRDKITLFDLSGYPVIELEKLHDDILKKSRFHKIISILVEGRYISPKHSEWRNNEILLRKAFKHVNAIINAYPGEQIIDPSGNPPEITMEDAVKNAMIRDINRFLYRCNALIEVNKNTQTINGMQILIRTYRYTGHLPIDPEEVSAEFTEFENRFIKNFEEWLDYMLAVVNSVRLFRGKRIIKKYDALNYPQNVLKTLTSWTYNVEQPFNNYHKWYQQMSKGPTFHYTREELDDASEKISKYIQDFKRRLPHILSRVIWQMFKGKSIALTNLQQNSNVFAGSASKIRRVIQQQNPPVIFKNDLSRQVVFVYGVEDEIKTIDKIIRDNKDTHRIVLITESFKKLKWLITINTSTPKHLQKDLVSAYGELKAFLES